jgi:mRNA interferase RelE/StbE
VKLILTDPAIKDLAGLDAGIRQRVKTALDRFLAQPEVASLRKLKNRQRAWRLRVGDWRVILEIKGKEDTIHVMRIKHRKEAYR